MSVPPYVTYVQNLSNEDLVDIVKELMAAKIIGRPEGHSKFSDCVAAVRDFFKNVNGFTDKDMAYIDGYAMAETTVRDEVFKRFVEIHDTQSRASVPNNIKTPYTNADKIRSMTDEALGKWICSIMSSDCCKWTCPARNMCGLNDNGLVKWLKQPAKED